VVLPAPGLVRALVPQARLPTMLGLWGAYMPLATALVLLLGPLVIQASSWPVWWWLLGGVTALMALWFARAVPSSATLMPTRAPGAVRKTLLSLNPALVACMFACYSGQWLAVIGFLPTIYTQAGVAPALTGVLTALAAAVNIVGNVMSGRLLQQGVQARSLLWQGFITMAVTSVLAFADLDQPPVVRYGAVLLPCGWRPAQARWRPPSAGCSSGLRPGSSSARPWLPRWPVAWAGGSTRGCWPWRCPVWG
jgi:MFS transporter, CP family, cyanate transporter